MNFIERNTKKIALALFIATALTAVSTVYAASTDNGWHDGVYYVDGEVKTEWLFEEDGPIYYLDENGRAVTGWKTINDSTYYFNANGERVSGQMVIDGYQYSFQENGKLLIGWQEDHTCFYNRFGVKVIGEYEIDGQSYYFDETGKVCTGLVEVNGKQRLYSEDGVLMNGWQTIEDSKYYFDKDGNMTTGWLKLDDAKYYFNKKGVMQTGWKTIDGTKYYFDKKSGKMATGKTKISGTTYNFAKDGSFKTGWQKNSDGKIMYYNDKGTALKGWQTIDGKKYYFDKKGYAYVNRNYDGYKFNSKGVATKIQSSSNKVTYSGGNLNPSGNKSNSSAANYALNFVGYRYVWGGSSPYAGFDCSGLVYYCYRSVGINVPRSGYSQAYMGKAVSYNNMKAGDVIIWNNGEHVSIYIGNGQMVHAANPRRGVEVNSVSRWASYGQSITSIRRP